jgi:hypothetical protein
MDTDHRLLLGLTATYLICFQGCAWPAIVRVCRRKSSVDLSYWREILLLVGVSCQLAVMLLTGAVWLVWLSPIASAVSVAALLAVIWRYR